MCLQVNACLNTLLEGKEKQRLRLIKGSIGLKNNQGEKYSYYIATCHLELFCAVVHH